MVKRIPIIFLGLFALLLFIVSPVKAENMSLGTAMSISLADKNSNEGDIIVATSQGYKKATQAYDPLMFGVVSKNPAVYLEDANIPNSTAIITSGKAYIRVSTINGPIKTGDYITSSTLTGIGQKATENGYSIGSAEENYLEKDPKKIGKVLVTLNPHFVQLTNNLTRNFFEGIKLGMASSLLTPLGALRYIVSGFLAILSFYMGFRYFGHTSRTGVEAIGRNPLATKAILLSIVMNVSITVAIMFFGVAIAYIILVI
jgi:hypothetical protein